MEINANGAVKLLKSVDNQIRAQIKPVPTKGQSADSIELGGSNATLSSGYVQLQTELSDKLASLTSLIGENSGQQKELAGLFGDAKNEDAVRQRAQELLDGYFNVENTGDRIFDFAFSHYKGGDREAFAREFQGYIHKGFAEAEKLLGGLSDISSKTRDYVDQRVEDFINEGKNENGETSAVASEELSAKGSKADDVATQAANQRAQILKRAYIPDVGKFE